MSRLMRNVRFRQDQHCHANDPHVWAINELVGQLTNKNGGRFVPRVAPHWGGIEAKVLILMSDPGVKTNPHSNSGGSGFLSSENDDDTAERLAEVLETAELPTSICVGWNIYPWYIRGLKSPTDELTAQQLGEGVVALGMLVRLLPKLQVVILCGGAAQTGWEVLTETYSQGLSERVDQIVALSTRSTGPFAFRFANSPEQRKAWERKQVNVFRQARRSATGL